MSREPKKTTALALYSGGLDSTLACRVVAAQGIKVIAVKFVTPFFGYNLLTRAAEHIDQVGKKYTIDLKLVDLSDDYLTMLRNPAHGYGKNFNPCVDCKILLLKKAKEMMAETGASFLITGEVVGQRPMSQRRDTLRIIERDSGCEELLVRPLCARNLNPTLPEINGLIDRERLLDFSGRTRKPQMRLAEKLGIRDYPSPAGGCTLTDPVLGKRIENYYRENSEVNVVDLELLLVGRQFKLPGGGRLALGRNQQDNQKIIDLRQPGDHVLNPLGIPGPTGILRQSDNPAVDLGPAAALLLRYAKKTGPETDKGVQVDLDGKKERQKEIPAVTDREIRTWQA